ncbi:MAG: branched-chain amino acid ABC transporter ATP-binding protein/permease [Dongiaceae bacterium]
MTDLPGRRPANLPGWRALPAWLRWVVAAGVLALLLLVLGSELNPYLLRLAILIALYACLAVGYNLVITEAGQFHLGFVAYFAVGAYAVAIPTTHFGWPFLPALALSVATVIAFSAVLGVLLLRFRGDYLSVVSLAAAEILRLVLANWRGLTGGYQGLPGVPPPELFGRAFFEQQWYLYLAGLLAFLTVLVVASMGAGGAGLAWRAIRQNERAALSVGLQVGLYKQLSFQIAGIFAGLAGGIYASYQTIVDPSLAAIDGSILLLTIVILGGGTLVGILAASAVLIALPEATRVFDEYRMLFLGLLFVVLMNWRPDGFGRQPRPLFTAADGGAPVPPRARGDVVPGRPLLGVEGLSRRFGGLKALDDVSLSVRDGEILGIIGPNGAGKTTLFNLVAGTFRPSAGQVSFAGTAVTGLSVERHSHLGIARTFQTIELCPGLTCLENVLLPRLARRPALALPFGRRGATRDAIAEALGALAFVGLGARADERAAALPYGDRRRLEIARALAAEPRLLLLDEPAAGMNQTEAQALVQTIRRIRDLGITVVLIEHNVRLVREASDRIVVLASGAVIADERPEAVLSSPRVIEAYLGKGADAAH